MSEDTRALRTQFSGWFDANITRKGASTLRDGNNTSYLYYCRQGDELCMRGTNEQGLTIVHHFTPQ